METLQRCTPMPFTERMAGARCRPAVRHTISQPETSTPTCREKSMADTENTLILETIRDVSPSQMRPDLAPGHVARSRNWCVRDFTMASCSIA